MPSPPSRPSAPPAITTWVTEHATSLSRFIRSFGVLAVEDAVQETFVVAARRVDVIEPGRERAFLYAVARRVAARARLRERRAQATPWEPQEPSPADVELEGHERRARVEEMIAAMPEELREVFVAFEMEELTKPEVAALLAIPEGTAASRKRRALTFAHDFVMRQEVADTAPLRGIRSAVWAHTHDWLEAENLSTETGPLSRRHREQVTDEAWMLPDEMMRLYAAIDGLDLSTDAAMDLGRYVATELHGRRIRALLERARGEPALGPMDALGSARSLWRATYAGGGFDLQVLGARRASLRVRVPMLRYAFYRTCLVSSVASGMAPFQARVRGGAFASGTFLVHVEV